MCVTLLSVNNRFEYLSFFKARRYMTYIWKHMQVKAQADLERSGKMSFIIISLAFFLFGTSEGEYIDSIMISRVLYLSGASANQ